VSRRRRIFVESQ